MRVSTKLAGWKIAVLLCAVSCSGHAAGAAATNDASGDAGKEAKDPRTKEVEQLVQHYFRSWSKPDMAAYGECFMPGAVVQYFDASGRLTTYSLKPFLASQRRAHLTARHKQTEVPLSIDIRFEANLARAVVYWKLTAGSREEFGYDHFTLAKQRDKWKIVNLVFYEVKKLEQRKR